MEDVETPRSSERLPLSTLLSWALVAFTVEFDNEFEHRAPHRTTSFGSTSGAEAKPWLVSLVMWSNCMQYVGDAGVGVGEMERLARTKTNLAGMQRWGYVVVAPDPADSRPKPPAADWIVRATPAGQRAQEIWRPLFGEIEERWRTRFGAPEVSQLNDALQAMVNQLDEALPDCLPILGYGLLSDNIVRAKGMAPARRDESKDASLPLAALLAKALLAFTRDFEREAGLSLAICADVLGPTGREGMSLRDLPRRSGVSKEAVAMAVKFLEKRGDAVVEADAGAGRSKTLRLTPKGLAALDSYHRLAPEIERRWKTRYGEQALLQLRASLERLIGVPEAGARLLMSGMTPYPDGWRAAVPKPETLPHQPMVLHRGGFPDGS
ncbi:MAG TPA: MarR family winged helix-turn-helix transcriptional regulator [Ktedonobacterales bacterium]|nr:MarR family winged helix-turn-helix transcriptional regulator [Ktedonobacterales bacterium]